MFFLSKFLPNIQLQNIKKLEEQADDVLELPGDLKAIRFEDEVTVVDVKKHKIIKKMKDTYPSTPARAAFEISKELGLFNEEETKKASKDVLTCNFRDDEQRWIWYKNLEPKMTVSFKEAFNDNEEKRQYFNSAKFGTDTITQIKGNDFEKVAKSMNALILEHSYVTAKCDCGIEDKYTIDDLVNQNKKASYDGKFVVCSACGRLLKL